MEIVLKFLTETLSGTTYIIVVVVAVILLFACIGFLAERSILRKKKEQLYAKENSDVSNQSVVEDVSVTMPNSVNLNAPQQAINQPNVTQPGSPYPAQVTSSVSSINRNGIPNVGTNPFPQTPLQTFPQSPQVSVQQVQPMPNPTTVPVNPQPIPVIPDIVPSTPIGTMQDQVNSETEHL